eukprot:1551392-Rhodomonas_salina.1
MSRTVRSEIPYFLASSRLVKTFDSWLFKSARASKMASTSDADSFMLPELHARGNNSNCNSDRNCRMND